MHRPSGLEFIDAFWKLAASQRRQILAEIFAGLEASQRQQIETIARRRQISVAQVCARAAKIGLYRLRKSMAAKTKKPEAARVAAFGGTPQ